LLAVCQEFEIESETIPQIASYFGGGIAGTGAVCGAVVGAVMAVGLKMGRGDTREERTRISALVQELSRRFEADMGTINCRELTGVDLTTEEGIEAYMSSDTKQTVCFPAVGIAFRLVMDLLQETS
jgi:C_GCAxxG_C_C family probable redox protein